MRALKNNFVLQAKSRFRSIVDDLHLAGDIKIRLLSGWQRALRPVEYLLASIYRLPASRLKPYHGQEVPVASAKDLAGRFLQSDTGGCYARPDEGWLVGAPDWSRNEIAMAYALGEVGPLEGGLAEFEDAIVCGEGIAVVRGTLGLAVVEETLTNAASARSVQPLVRASCGMLTADLTGNYPRLPGAHVLMRRVWDKNYGHWLVDCLPKIDIVKDHYVLPELKFIVSNSAGPMQRLFRDTLDQYGVKPSQVITLGRKPTIVERLIYPLPVTAHPFFKTPRAIVSLEELGRQINGAQSGPKRIYISRACARRRQLRNEHEILQILQAYGFTVVYPEQHCFVSQVKLFSSAEIIIGAAGANLTNAVFSPRKITLFALVSYNFADNFYWDLMNAKEGRYISLRGAAVEGESGPHADFQIDKAVFGSMVHGVMADLPAGRSQ